MTAFHRERHGVTLKSALKSLSKSQQFKSLDGLRAIAILLVLVTHICQRIPGVSYIRWNVEWATPLYNGWVGVDLFFVLSGFLIGHALIKALKNNAFSVINFYIQRFFRIIPAYFVVIALIVLLQHFHHQAYLPEFHQKDILLNLGLVTDYFASNIGIPSWSLSIEEHFYLLLPFFLILIRKTETRTQWIILLIFAALIARMLTYRIYSIGENFPNAALMKIIYYPFHNRMDALAVGVLVALLFDYVTDSRLFRLISCSLGGLLVGFVLLTGALQGGFFYTTIQYTLICLGFGGILMSVLKSTSGNSKVQAVLSSFFWVPIARISYSVYLTHLLVIAILAHFIAFKGWMFCLILLACLLAALPLYLFIEYPFHQFARKRFSIGAVKPTTQNTLAPETA